MHFDSYIVSETKTAKTVLPPPHCSKAFGDLKAKPFLKKKAFTLAETLITLAIIGVIAALTVPTLISKYQKHTYVVRLKKAYSQLQHAIKMIPITEGCPAGDYECAGFNNSNSIDGQNFRDIGEKQLYLLSKQFKVKTINNNYQFVTDDGMIFDGYAIFDAAMVYIDINGEKYPNRWGRDIFQFFIPYTNSWGLPAGTVIPNGSKLWSQYSGNNYEYWRNTGSYYACTTSNVNDNSDKTRARKCAGRVLEEDAMNY